jgi:hypothetical protein
VKECDLSSTLLEKGRENVKECDHSSALLEKIKGKVTISVLHC